MAYFLKIGTIILYCVLSTKTMVGVLGRCLWHTRRIKRRILSQFLQDGASS